MERKSSHQHYVGTCCCFLIQLQSWVTEFFHWICVAIIKLRGYDYNNFILLVTVQSFQSFCKWHCIRLKVFVIFKFILTLVTTVWWLWWVLLNVFWTMTIVWNVSVVARDNHRKITDNNWNLNKDQIWYYIMLCKK